MIKALLFVVLAAALTGCSKPQPPVGKWEGGYESGGDLVVARVEILPNGQVRVMAPDITNAVGPRERIEQLRARLSADLANGWSDGNDQGMFNAGDEPDGVAKWNPRPAFYYMYYFQKYFGDRMVGSSVTGGNGDVLSYASSFSSGEAGVVIVNKGTVSQTVKVNISNFKPGTRYYYYTLTGGTDNGEFSGKVYVNGNGPGGANGGPANYLDLNANSSSLANGLKLSVPPRAVIYLVAESKK